MGGELGSWKPVNAFFKQFGHHGTLRRNAFFFLYWGGGSIRSRLSLEQFGTRLDVWSARGRRSWVTRSDESACQVTRRFRTLILGRQNRSYGTMIRKIH